MTAVTCFLCGETCDHVSGQENTGNINELLKVLKVFVHPHNLSDGWGDGKINCGYCRDGIETLINYKMEFDEVEERVRNVQLQLLSELKLLQELLNVMQLRLHSLGQKGCGRMDSNNNDLKKFLKLIKKAVSSVDLVQTKRGRRLLVISGESALCDNESDLHRAKYSTEASEIICKQETVERQVLFPAAVDHDQYDHDSDYEPAQRLQQTSDDGSDFESTHQKTKRRKRRGRPSLFVRPKDTPVVQLSKWKLLQKGRTGDGKYRPFSCQFCGRGFTSLANLYRHLSWVHNQGPYKPKDPIVCEICSFVAPTRWSLRKHMKTHVQDKDNDNSVFEPEALRRTSHEQKMEKVANAVENETSEESMELPLKVGVTEVKYSPLQEPGNFNSKQRRKRHVSSEIDHADPDYETESAEKIDTDCLNVETEASEREPTGRKKGSGRRSTFVRPKDTPVEQLGPAKINHKGRTADGKPRPFSCQFCGRGYTSLANLNRHLSWTHNQGPYKPKDKIACEVCGQIAITKWHLRKHMKTHDSESLNNVDLVENDPLEEEEEDATQVKYLPPEKLLRKRETDDGKDRSFSCDICSRKYTSQAILNRHLSWTHNHGPYTPRDKHRCVICNYMAGYPAKLRQHLNKHLKEKVIKDEGTLEKLMEEDKERYKERIPRKLKIKRSTSAAKYPRPHACEVCKRTYTSLPILQRHLGFAHGIGGYKRNLNHICEKCGYVATFRLRLRQHMETHLPPEEREQTPCHQCGTLVSSVWYKSHVKYHCTKRVKIDRESSEVVCDECGQTVKNSVSLYHHKRQLHQQSTEALEGRKKVNHADLICHVCGRKGFPTKGQFTTHVARHSGKRNHICDLCGGPFKEKRHLIRHARTCDGSKLPKKRASRLVELDSL